MTPTQITLLAASGIALTLALLGVSMARSPMSRIAFWTATLMGVLALRALLGADWPDGRSMVLGVAGASGLMVLLIGHFTARRAIDAGKNRWWGALGPVALGLVAVGFSRARPAPEPVTGQPVHQFKPAMYDWHDLYGAETSLESKPMGGSSPRAEPRLVASREKSAPEAVPATAPAPPVEAEVPVPSPQAKPQQQFEKAWLAIEYRAEARLAWDTLSDLPEAPRQAFLEGLHLDPRADPDKLAADILESHRAEVAPLDDDEMNSARRKMRTLGDDAEAEFLEAAATLGDAVPARQLAARIHDRRMAEIDARIIAEIQNAPAKKRIAKNEIGSIGIHSYFVDASGKLYCRQGESGDFAWFRSVKAAREQLGIAPQADRRVLWRAGQRA
jgi:hypothetical protein